MALLARWRPMGAAAGVDRRGSPRHIPADWARCMPIIKKKAAKGHGAWDERTATGFLGRARQGNCHNLWGDWVWRVAP